MQVEQVTPKTEHSSSMLLLMSANNAGSLARRCSHGQYANHATLNHADTSVCPSKNNHMFPHALPDTKLRCLAVMTVVEAPESSRTFRPLRTVLGYGRAYGT